MATLTGDGIVPIPSSHGLVRSKHKIYNMGGPVRPNGVTIFCFIGPPNRAVTWTLMEGGGAITPFAPSTDQYGRSTCRYEAGGWTGHVVIGVQYGA